MSGESGQQSSLKEKVVHESEEFLGIFFYLALFLEVFAAYRMLLLREYQINYVSYVGALITALVLAKIIMIGEYAGFGKRHEHRRLFVSTIYKALVFGLLAVAFHIVEEIVKALIHHKPMTTAFEPLREPSGIFVLLTHALILFCAFIPFFAIREIRRVLGGRQLYDLFFEEESTSR